MTSDESKQLIDDNGYISEGGDNSQKDKSSKKRKFSFYSGLVSFCKSFTRFPVSVYFIVGNEFCERFAYYGMRAVLVLYLITQLDLSEDNATAVFHMYTFLAYFMPIFGSMIADSYIGKFKTILLFSIIYSFGCLSISLSAVPCLVGYIVWIRLVLCLIGLMLIAVGTGGIKPCVSAFGGDQIKKGDDALLTTFFSLFYFSINAGSLLSIFLTPILRVDLQCFGDDCYAASFGVPAVLMICSIIVFVAGSFLYVKVPPTRHNVYFQIFGIIFYAIYQRIKKRKTGLKKDHWLDWAEPKYDPSLVLGVKAIVKVFYMFLPLPIFWALFDQQGSRWILQATRMDTSIGFLNIPPDQVQILNPILILVFIPIFDRIIYPLVNKCGIKVTTLKRMTCGIFFAGCAFILSAIVQIQIENGADLSPPNGFAFLKVFNPTSQQANFSVSNSSNILMNSSIAPMNFVKHEIHTGEYKLSFTIEESGRRVSFIYDVNLNSSLTCSILLSNSSIVKPICVDMNLAQPDIAKEQASIQFINSLPKLTKFYMRKKSSGEIECNKSVSSLEISEFCKITEGEFLVDFENLSVPIRFQNGDVYSLLAYPLDSKNVSLQQYFDVQHSVSVLWQIPMFVVITIGEVMFSISGLEFAYSQAPKNLKSVMGSLFLLTISFGNLIVFIVSQFQLFSSQIIEFFFFAGAAILISVLFGFMSYFYKYMQYQDEEPEIVSSPSIRKTFTESQREAEKID